MPGYVMHLAVASELIRSHDIKDEDYIANLLLGSIAPDVRKGNFKKNSHFWTDDNFKEFERKPDVDKFIEQYGDKLDNPYVLGYYAHLYMDKFFIEDYWKKHYEFYDKDMNRAVLFNDVKLVKMIVEKRVIPREDFFSSDMYYGDYDRMNSYIIDRYDVTVPILHKKLKHQTVEPGGVSVSEEWYQLNAMVEAVGKTKKDSKYPNTTVFNVDDMDKLIMKVSAELSDKLRSVRN